uniref:Uncharacterized protein n=1 Tax=Romanomermis culicivorax TaxID=13658 RepID=A0A915JBC6_ROMCU
MLSESLSKKINELFYKNHETESERPINNIQSDDISGWPAKSASKSVGSGIGLANADRDPDRTLTDVSAKMYGLNPKRFSKANETWDDA